MANREDYSVKLHCFQCRIFRADYDSPPTDVQASHDLYAHANPWTAELLANIFHSFQAGIAYAIFSFK